jgi:hypothetical protein
MLVLKPYKRRQGFRFPLQNKEKIEIHLALYFFYMASSFAFEGKSPVALIG